MYSNFNEEKLKTLSKLLKTIGNPMRLKILALCTVKERTSKELRSMLGISKPLLIAHIKKLVKLGLLKYRVEVDKNKMIIKKYYKTPDNINIIINNDILKELLKDGYS